MNTFKMDSAKGTGTNTGFMLPVVELVIAIGLFTIISIFLIKFFTSANTMSRDADDLSKGLIKAESAIELSKVFSLEKTADELGGKLTEGKDGKLIEAYYDKDWKRIDTADNFKYLLTITIAGKPNASGVLSDIRVSIQRKDRDKNTVIVDLEGAKYTKGGK